MVKRDSQRQKTENCRLTMKMAEMKNEMTTTTSKEGANGGGEEAKNEAPPQKKQKVVVEQMPEDWKIKCYSESPKAEFVRSG